MKPVLCTLFDANYLVKGLAFLRSLQIHQSDFQVFVLALDAATQRAVTALRDVRIVTLPFAALESYGLEEVLAPRTRAEQCWTLTPYWMRSVFEIFQVPQLAYMDADSFLFHALDPLYREVTKHDASTAIIPHRFPPSLTQRAALNGIYNVNWVFARNDEMGRQAIADWTGQCFEWCYARTERSRDGALRFGDQAYLDDWTRRYGAHVVTHPGANLAPWNQMQYEYEFNERLYVVTLRRIKPGSQIESEHPGIERIDRLLFYHFHGYESRQQQRSSYTLHPKVMEYVYRPYEQCLAEIAERVASN